ncbi:MAG: transcriptional regulator NrdR [Rickettsiales bacterium]
MFCPFCKHHETVVKNSRLSDDGSSTRRRRECPNCNSRFTTYERIQYKEILIIKKSGAKEFFDYQKLLASIKMALRKRNITADILDNIAGEIYQELNLSNESEIKSNEVGELVMNKLKLLDKVAFIRFASVYKNFESIEDFENFLRNN